MRDVPSPRPPTGDPALLAAIGACALLVHSSLTSCASVDPGPDFAQAGALIRESTGAEEVFEPGEAALTEADIATALADGLGLDEAMRLALLNNRRLQARFMTLGIARADLVQAGLLSNPSLSLLFLFPSDGGRANVQASLAQSVSDLWQIPARERVARAGLASRLLEVSRFAGTLVADTRDAYYDAVFAREAVSVARENAELVGRALNAVRTRAREGVASAVEENLAQGLALNAELEFRRSERERTGTARRLAALLSLTADLAETELLDPLPESSRDALAREDVVEIALRRRLDLLALDREVDAADAAVRLERRGAWPAASISADAERPEGGGDELFGPGASITLPVFDQNRAGIARAEYRKRELERTREALACEIGHSVRAAVDRARLATSLAAFLQDEFVAQAERSAALARRGYELGDVTLLALIESERARLLARRSELEGRLEVAHAWNEVERAAGTPIAGHFAQAR